MCGERGAVVFREVRRCISPGIGVPFDMGARAPPAARTTLTSLEPTSSPAFRPRPLALAGCGRALALAGAQADGVILGNMTPSGVARSAGIVTEAVSRCGRPAGDVDLIGRVSLLVDDDIPRARAVVRPIAGFYLSTGIYRASLGRQGFGEEVDRFATRWDGGDRALALEELGDELLSAFAVFGDAATVKARIADFRAAGLAAPILYPIIPMEPGRSPDEVLAATIEVLALCRDA